MTRSLLIKKNLKQYGFRKFRSLKELLKSIYYGEILIPAIERKQDAFDHKITELKKYRARKTDKIDERKNLLINAQNFYDGIKMIIQAFKNNFFFSILFRKLL